MFFGPKIKILVVLPEKDFDETQYQQILRACKEAKIQPVIGCISKGPCLGMIKERVKPNVLLDDVDITEYHGIVFIGGLGTRDLFNSLTCHKLIQKAFQLNRIVAGIDLGPLVIAHAEILKGRKGTIHPTEETHFIATGVIYLKEPVVIDGNIITARDKHAAVEFSDMVVGAVLRNGEIACLVKN